MRCERGWVVCIVLYCTVLYYAVLWCIVSLGVGGWVGGDRDRGGVRVRLAGWQPGTLGGAALRIDPVGRPQALGCVLLRLSGIERFEGRAFSFLFPSIEAYLFVLLSVCLWKVNSYRMPGSPYSGLVSFRIPLSA